MRYFQRQALKTAIQNQLLDKKSTDWRSLTKIQRRDIVTKLMASQKALCAYCESRISRKDYHIEHFEEQQDNEKIFNYDNLLLCCQGNTDAIIHPETDEDAEIRKSNMSCGHRKTKSHHGDIDIDYTLLLNPTNNVSALFSYTDGIIEASKNCAKYEAIQVKYTINRLNLDAKRLKNARKNEIDEIIMQLDERSISEQKVYIQGLLDETQDVLNPYFSTIKDNFAFLLTA